MAHTSKPRRFGMVIDLDRCTGCGACMVACAAENNVAPAAPKANDRNGITPMRVFPVHNGKSGAEREQGFLPVLCMHCASAPCETVCPQQAVEIDKNTGIVTQMPQRCLGCRYCMTACPYHARYFNWWDPEWPGGMEATLNPAVSPRMRGVVEKCNLCPSRLHAADDAAVAQGQKAAATYEPACVESCPTAAMVFGDLNDPQAEVTRLAQAPATFQLLAKIGTGPKVSYHSSKAWIRSLAERDRSTKPAKGAQNA